MAGGNPSTTNTPRTACSLPACLPAFAKLFARKSHHHFSVNRALGNVACNRPVAYSIANNRRVSFRAFPTLSYFSELISDTT